MSDDLEGKGARTAVVEAMNAAGPLTVDQPEQLGLLPLLGGDQLAAMPTDPAARRKAVQAAKRGRAQGSQNALTTKVREVVLKKHGVHPLEALFQAFSRPTEDLAAQLGCSILEAYKIQLLAAREALPYVQSKMPVAIDVQGDLPMLVLTQVGQAAAAGPVLEHGPLSDAVSLDDDGGCDA